MFKDYYLMKSEPWVQAVCYYSTADNNKIKQFAGKYADITGKDFATIDTPKGKVALRKGDYIIKFDAGVFYVESYHDFHDKYYRPKWMD